MLPVLSGVPQGSVLGHVIFFNCVTDLPSVLYSSGLLLFTDNIKCTQPVHNPHDIQLLQSNLNSLSGWNRRWLPTFNTSKCTTLHFFSSTNLKDAGVAISSDPSWSQHYLYIAMPAYYKILGFLRSSFGLSKSICTKNVLYLSG